MKLATALCGPVALLLCAQLAAQESESADPATAASAVDQSAERELTPEEQAAADEMIEKGEITVERKICRVITNTGSIMPKKICRTRQEEEYDHDVAVEFMRIMTERLESQKFQQMLRDGGPP